MAPCWICSSPPSGSEIFRSPHATTPTAASTASGPEAMRMRLKLMSGAGSYGTIARLHVAAPCPPTACRARTGRLRLRLVAHLPDGDRRSDDPVRARLLLRPTGRAREAGAHHPADRQPRPGAPQLPAREGRARGRAHLRAQARRSRPRAGQAHPRRLPLLLLGRQPRGVRALRHAGGAVTAVHIAIGAALIAVNALAAVWGGWRWHRRAPSRAFWVLLRAGQALVLIAAIDGAVLVVQGRELASLPLVYGLTPIAVAFFAEQLRLASAQTVLDRIGLD